MKTCEESKSNKGKYYEKSIRTCDYCKKEFQSPSHLKRHAPVHTGEKDYHCNLCGYSCAKSKQLENHIRHHLNERPFKCEEVNCGASFTSSFHLKKHQLIHGKREKRFCCSSCSFKTHSKLCLSSHIKSIHSESKLFKCPQENCEYSAKRKDHLNQHIQIHSQEKDKVCSHPNCGFKTKWSPALKRHMEIHSNEDKRFKCRFCSYSCNQHSHLVIHIRRHLGETPFACQLCPYKSKTRSHLNSHMKTHSN